MSKIKSCGLVANPSDGIDRITLITIRYMAWIGEALSTVCHPIGHRTPDRKRVAACGQYQDAAFATGTGRFAQWRSQGDAQV